jgi:hypothetical protein
MKEALKKEEKNESTHAEMICHHITLFFYSHHRIARAISIKFDCEWLEKKAIFNVAQKIIDFQKLLCWCFSLEKCYEFLMFIRD